MEREKRNFSSIFTNFYRSSIYLLNNFEICFFAFIECLFGNIPNTQDIFAYYKNDS